MKPSLDSVIGGKYNPFSRPLFLYVSQKAAEKPEVKQLIDFILTKGQPLISEVKYVPLPANAYAAGIERMAKKELGTAFGGVPEVGLHIDEILKKKPVM